jgi:polyhydroxyalkanoate synthase subunit PhaC
VNNYLDKSVDKIREHSDSEKISIFGYCWGGDLALIYAARHPEKVKNVITLATPVDFSLDNGLLSLWTKKINVESLVDAFGTAPSMMLNTAFALISPVDYLHKYPHFFEKPRDIESIMEFLATELWLYDSPPVIGEIYREIVKDCYQENLSTTG